MFNVTGLHVLAQEHDDGRLVLTVEAAAEPAGCPSCEVVAVGHCRWVHEAADAPCFGLATRVRWRKRLWRRREPACPRGTWSEDHDFLAPRAKLTARAVAWATAALTDDDTTVSALARHLARRNYTM